MEISFLVNWRDTNKDWLVDSLQPFKKKILTIAAKLKVLACTPSEMGAEVSAQIRLWSGLRSGCDVFSAADCDHSRWAAQRHLMF